MVAINFKTSVIVALVLTLISIVLNYLLSVGERKLQFWNVLFWFHTKRGSDFQTQKLIQFDLERFKSETHFGPSSVWCSFSGDRFNESYCKIEHLCLKPDTEEYFFVWHPNQSTFYPPWLQNTAQGISYGHMSSVLDHNRYDMNRLVTVPWDKLDHLNDHLHYQISGSVVVMSRFKPDNLLHLLHDDVLPLLATILEQTLEHRLKYIFFDDHWNHTFGHLFFQALSSGVLYLHHFPRKSIICFETAHIGLSRSTVWYQYGFKKPQGPVTRNREELTYVSNSILRLKTKIIDHLHLSSQCFEYFTLLVARSRTRKILNLPQLLDYLRGELGSVRLVEVTNAADQSELLRLIPMVQCAHTLLAMHGSELILSIFMQPGSRVVELFPYGIEPHHFSVYRTLASIMRHQYISWVNLFKSNGYFHAEDYPTEWGGLSDLSLEERQQVEQVDQALEPHLCCDNPHWLYRIYQDTVVDVNTLHLALFSSLTKTADEPVNTFELSEVCNLTCWVDANQTHISWMPPWNLEYISSITSVKYAILVQPLDSNQGVSLVSSESSVEWSHHHYPVLHCARTQCLVWVRTEANTTSHLIRITSNYNRHPAHCKYHSV